MSLYVFIHVLTAMNLGVKCTKYFAISTKSFRFQVNVIKIIEIM
jgi:hypothetical protein